MESNFASLESQIYRLVEDGRLAHAYAFTGADEEAKGQLTIAMIQALVCPAFSEEGQPDKTCSICQRAADNQLSDVVYVQAEGRHIKVDQIRQLREWLSTSPVELDFKLACLPEAHLLNEAASNALLKFLEEPVDNAYIVLHTPVMSQLLPTIQSRVQSFHLVGQSSQSGAGLNLQEGVNPEHAQLLARFSRASAERLLDQYDEEGFAEWLKAWNHFYSLLIQRNGQAFVSVQAQLKAYLSSQGALDGLEYLAILNHSALMLQANQWQEDRDIQKFFLEDLLNRYRPSIKTLTDLNDAFIWGRERMLANVSPQLVLEQLSLHICHFEI